MELPDVDDEFLFIWCGTEAGGHFIGPFRNQEEVDVNLKEESWCEHDHPVFRMTGRMLANKFRPLNPQISPGIGFVRSGERKLLTADLSTGFENFAVQWIRGVLAPALRSAS